MMGLPHANVSVKLMRFDVHFDFESVHMCLTYSSRVAFF